MENKQLTKRELIKIWSRWARFHLSSMSYEKLQGHNWAYTLTPLADKYYKNNPKEYGKLLKRHSVFYNTEPQTGAIVNGIVTSLEEEKALGKDISEEIINNVKTTLMGPIAGIGDAIIQGIIVPVLLSIAMGLAAGGNPIGPIFYMIAYGIIGPLISYTCYTNGYKLGLSAVDKLIGENSQRLRDSFNLLGVMVVGGLASTYVVLTTKIQIPYGDSTQPLQAIMDGNFPKLLPLVMVLLSWWMLASKKMSATKVILILTAIVSVGVIIGVF